MIKAEWTNKDALDVVSRQDAIDALKEHRSIFCDSTPETFSVLPYGEKCRVDEIDNAIATLINLPSAQPKLGELASNLHQSIKFDAIQVIRCKDCKNPQFGIDVAFCEVVNRIITPEDYCCWAERKEE